MRVIWFEIFFGHEMDWVVCGGSGNSAESFIDSFERMGVWKERRG